MTRTSKILVTAVLAGVVVAAALWYLPGAEEPPAAPGIPARGGVLIATYRSEPYSFNRHVQASAADELFSRLTTGRLVRLNRVTGEFEPWLAEKWTASPDGLTFTITLRDGLTFSDGIPFTSDDVVFTWEYCADPATATVNIASLPSEPNSLQIFVSSQASAPKN